MNPMFDRLEQIEAKHEELNAGPGLARDHHRLGSLPEDRQGAQRACAHRREVSRVQRADAAASREQGACSSRRNRSRDARLRAGGAARSWKSGFASVEEELKVLLLPKDPNDEKNVVLEIRAGTGGDEATLFAAEIFRMYTRYAESQRWKVEVLSTLGIRRRRAEGSHRHHRRPARLTRS